MSVKLSKILPALLAGLLLVPASALAQTAVDDENDFRTRVSVGFDKKLSKGFHFSALEQFRFQDNSSEIDCFISNFALSYKINSYLKAGVSYALVNPYKSSKETFNNPRHRFAFDLTGSVKSGDWTFSLKERFQVTHRSGSFNTYQNPTNAMLMKTRLMAKYRGYDWIKPYGYIELRNTLNAPAIKATYNSAKGTYSSTDGSTEPGWFISGWNNAYINRVRGTLGCNVPLGDAHELDLYLMTDYYTDKKVDASSDGKELQSYTLRHGINVTLGIGYTFSF